MKILKDYRQEKKVLKKFWANKFQPELGHNLSDFNINLEKFHTRLRLIEKKINTLE
ncbi:hypothetical protein Dfri01_37330 [Dyadobacter frigoris]|nr:hypothetical protein Dfri01_37330 [Dyadobacter frigoris]